MDKDEVVAKALWEASFDDSYSLSCFPWETLGEEPTGCDLPSKVQYRCEAAKLQRFLEAQGFAIMRASSSEAEIAGFAG